MSYSYRHSFIIIVSMIFLLPLFFIPGGVLDLFNAKAALISLGAILVTLFFLFDTWKGKGLSFPKHHLLTAVLFLPVVYLLSALLSTPSSLSLFGYNLEAGTFGSILLGVLLLFLSAVVFSNAARALQATFALFGSLSVLAIFGAVKILSGGTWLVLGNFAGLTGNPLGDWTDLAIVSALLSILSIMALGMLPMKASFKALLYGIFLLSTSLLVVLHFWTAFILSTAAAVLLFFYFSNIEKHFHFQSKGEKGQGDASSGNFFSRPTFLPIVLGVVSLLFLVNPHLPGTSGPVGDMASSFFGIANTDVHPTLSATLSVSKSALSQNVLLGSGPNTFGRDWLLYRPTNVNLTPFWATEFPFGAGFIPTEIATTGIVGIVLWFAFFAFLITLAFKALTSIPESRSARFTLVFTLAVSLFLWTATFFYTPSDATFMLAFIFTGIFVALSAALGIIPAYNKHFKETPARYVSLFVLILALVGTLSLGWLEIERTLGAFHFKRGADLSTVAGTSVERVAGELDKAVTFAPLDSYFSVISRLNFSRAQVFANSATGTPEQNRALFEESLGKSIQAARAAVNANPESYNNWVSLGLIYSSLVPEPLKLDGAYESARFAYNEAFKRNPSNPELSLLLAQLELNKGNVDDARSFIRTALALKEDYADAYLFLARLEAGAKNIPAAIASTEKLVTLSPENAGIRFELGVLKYTARDYQGALASLQKALELSPDYANAKYYLALSLANLGRKEEAKTLLTELLSANPGNSDIEKALNEVSKK